MKLKAQTKKGFEKAIQREQAKRATTYPRLIAKGKLNEHTAAIRAGLLQTALEVLTLPLDIDFRTELDILEELCREMTCRIRYYPRMILFSRITAETADFEAAAWRELLEYWASRYGAYPIVWLKTSVRIKTEKEFEATA
jgi:hypothetical protein